MSLNLHSNYRVKNISDIPNEAHWQIIGMQYVSIDDGWDGHKDKFPEIYVYTSEAEWLQDVEILSRFKSQEFRAMKVEVAVPKISITVDLK